MPSKNNKKMEEMELQPLSRQGVAPEGRQAQAVCLEGDNDQQVTSPPARPPPIPLSEWTRILDDAKHNLESLGKFYEILIYTIGFQTVWIRLSTITVSLWSPIHEYERWSTIILHTVSCLITVAFVSFNKCTFSKSRLKNECKLDTFRDSLWFNFVLNFFCIEQPIRYWNNYYKRKSYLEKIRAEQLSTHQGTLVTDRCLYPLVELTEGIVEDCRASVFEVHLQLIPMAMREAYFLFHTHIQPKIENLRDFFRLVPILSPFYIACCAICALELAIFDLEQALYIMEYFKSNKLHGVVTYPEEWIGTVRICNFIQNFFTLVLRTYTIIYFLVRSLWLAAFFMLVLFLVNLGMLLLLPQYLLSIHQNAPFGMSTRSSYWSDRILNIFSNVNTRFSVMTNSTVKTWFTLFLIQLSQWGIPLGLTLWIESYFIPAEMPQLKIANTTLFLDNCTMAHDKGVLEGVQKALFSSFISTNQGYGGPFKSFHMLWLLFILQFAFVGVHAYCESRMRKKDPKSNEQQSLEEKQSKKYHIPVFPIRTAYAFYANIFEQISEMTGETKVWALRKLMLGTALEEPRFYSALRVWCIFPKSTLTNEEVEKWTNITVSNRKTPDDQVEARIREALNIGAENHRFYNEFVKMANIIAPNCVQNTESVEAENGAETANSPEVTNDMKIFLRFIAYFDIYMSLMSSDKLERIFKLIEMPVAKMQDKDEIVSIEIA